MSPEEFFMYLTIGLIVLAPVAARLYRRVTLKRTQAMLRRQFGDAGSGKSQPTEKGK
jgi:hypothetical protein